MTITPRATRKVPDIVRIFGRSLDRRSQCKVEKKRMTNAELEGKEASGFGFDPDSKKKLQGKTNDRQEGRKDSKGVNGQVVMKVTFISEYL